MRGGDSLAMFRGKSRQHRLAGGVQGLTGESMWHSGPRTAAWDELWGRILSTVIDGLRTGAEQAAAKVSVHERSPGEFDDAG